MDEGSTKHFRGESSPGSSVQLPSQEDANLPSVITSPYCADCSSTLQHEDKSGLVSGFLVSRCSYGTAVIMRIFPDRSVTMKRCN